MERWRRGVRSGDIKKEEYFEEDYWINLSKEKEIGTEKATEKGRGRKS